MPDDKQPKVNRTQQLMVRANEIANTGVEHSLAVGEAFYESRIENWPTKWGHTLQILVYGDFQAPTNDLDFDELGITLHHKPVEKSIAGNMVCSLNATVNVTEKSAVGLTDAVRRINVFLGTWTLITWGNGSIRWWSYLTHGSVGGSLCDFDSHDDWREAVSSALKLSPQVRRRVDAALYWIRETRASMREKPNCDVLRMYSGYWNAFECLIDAIDLLVPQKKKSKLEKQEQLDEYISARADGLTANDIATCYREIVNPGFVGKAKHALAVCFPETGDDYVYQCFERSDRDNRLYDIRNAINHGDVDAESVKEIMRIENRLSRLTILVL